MPPTLLSPAQHDTDLSSGIDATAVIYVRVSSDGQVNKAHNPEGYSIPTQREACERHAERLGARVVAEFVELGRTGTNLHRPALKEMLDALPELRPTYVIFYDLSRVAREEQDAFWLLGEIKRHGSKLESTLERIDDSPQGLLLYAIMAGVNAFRSRGDGEKVKGGLARKHAEGGSMGPARIGYLNDSETVEGRKIATISVDPDRAHYVQLAFDLATTGDHTITTITEILEEAGLRTRGTHKRPSRPLSRSMIHRMLRDDYYIGIVTLNSLKREGRHEALIDPATFEQVQKILDGHRASGDRSQRHYHYLKGTLVCACGKRLGYGRHRGKCGGVYEYFSCLSRVQRGGRCEAPYFPVEQTERAVVRRYKHETLNPAQRATVRQTLRDYVQTKAEVARRASERHNRRLRELTGQQQKLVQLFYNGGVSEEVLQAEQERINTEKAKAQQWADAATREVEDVMGALDDALALLDNTIVIYETLPHSPGAWSTRRSSSCSSSTTPTPSTPSAPRSSKRSASSSKTSPQPRRRPKRPQNVAARASPRPARPTPKTTPTPIFGAGVRTSNKWRRGRDSNPRWSLTPILA